MNQTFRALVPPTLLFELLEQCCLKTDKYFYIDLNAFRKMMFHELHAPFLASVREYYHVSKQFYVDRKLTYNSWTNIVRQICKSNSILFTSKTKYNESSYNIDFYIYFTAAENLV